jgi:alpha-amylase/alpha-mannosidase (GH57 family)
LLRHRRGGEALPVTRTIPVNETRYLCIHGHFYQPPRENPWLEAIELQDSAAPYHDWNERITAECYAPNSAARILDAQGLIAKIVNNYSGISFNFGPTLLSWMKDKDPATYQKILDADRASAERFSGHGSAIAQCYNHMIMPLANARDKLTQVIWGIEDFRFRFGRRPEGMWLPETAVDLETLDLMAQHGIQFTILAPSQAKSMDGIDVTGQRIDPARAYRQKLPSGRSIHLFFYDGPVSQAVAFERLLNDGGRFASRLLDALSDQREGPQLAHIATDGETYGHHHAFGDMALAYALDHIERSGLAKITNYGEFLEKHPAEHDADVLENTAWSCVHGVGRWSTNCGCNSGGHGDWNQEWRAPLRRALDWLRDEVAPCYEKMAARFFKNPWTARNNYIHVILDRMPESRERFAAANFRRKSIKGADRVNVWKLLELQRHAMLMYTSCGWFFDELSGIETVQVIQYAGRVVQLAEELFGNQFEERFLEKLALAKSNIAEHGDGRAIYEKFVKPASVDLLKLGAHYAMSSLFESYPDNTRIYAYSVDNKDYRLKRSGKMRLAFGKARFTSEITQDSEMLMFGVLHFGDHNLHGGVALYSSEDAYRELSKSTREAFNRSDLAATIHCLDQGFAGHTYSLKNLFRDEQRKVLTEVLESTVEHSFSVAREIYEDQAQLLQFMSDCGIPIPRELKAAAEVALNGLLRQALASPDLDQAAIQTLLEEMRIASIPLDQNGLEIVLRRNLEKGAGSFFEDSANLERLTKFRENLVAARSLPFPLVLWSVQNSCYEVLQKAYPQMREPQIHEKDWMEQFRQLAALLSLQVPEPQLQEPRS